MLQINPASLTGHVLEERDGQTPVPAVGATVTLDDGVTTVTDSSGAFVLTGLLGGPRTVRFALAGFTDAATHSVTLAPGQSTTLPDVKLALARGTIAGEVAMGDGLTSQGVLVSVDGTNYATTVTPGSPDPSHGAFQIIGVPVGSYSVSASKSAYVTASISSVVVTQGSTVLVGTLTLAHL